MQDTPLLYDAFAVPEWALRLLLVSIFALAYACSRLVVGRLRSRPAGITTRGFAALAGICLLVAGTSVAERQHAFRNAGASVVEGRIDDVWAQQVPRGDSTADSHCEGFRVAGVRFAYTRDAMARPYFHNAGPQPIVLREGDRLRVHYVVDRHDAEGRNRIVRLERLPAIALPAGPGTASEL